MPNYHPAAKSLVYGLSDFWTMYFKELPLLEEIYRGVEIDIGQSYLDLLSLLLNSSTQDAALFDRQHFKLLRLREDAVTYGSDGKYGVALASDVVSVKYINNKVFGTTAALERDRDFVFDQGTKNLLFDYDIFAAYRNRTFGAGVNQYSVTTVVPEPHASSVTFAVVSDATHPPQITRSGDAVTVHVDSAVTSVLEVVALVNSSSLTDTLLRAGLVDGSPGAGTGLIAAVSVTGLRRSPSAPLHGYATRSFDVLFGTRFTDSLGTAWLDTDVQKGDVLRIIGGGDYGAPQEFPIALVRDAGLVLYPQAAPEDVATSLEYAVLRDAADSQSLNEAFSAVGNHHGGFDTSAVIVAATRTLEWGTPAYPLTEYHVGEVLTLLGAQNAGEYRIREVIQVPPSVVLDGNPLVDETGVTVDALFAVSTTSMGGGAALSAGVLTDPAALFGAHMVGGVIAIAQGGAQYRSLITRYVSTTEIEIEPAEGLLDASGLTWGVAHLAPIYYTCSYAPPFAWPTDGTARVAARRYIDGQAVELGRDYTLSPDTGSIRTRTVWQSTDRATCSYQFRTAVYTTRNALQSGTDGSLLASPSRFDAPTAVFTAAAVGSVLRVSGATLATNDGIYRVDQLLSTTSVAVTRLDGVTTYPDAATGALEWAHESRAAAVVTDVIEPVTELGVWAPDALVDKYHLYYTYGYLINRVQESSESYRSLIRGVFQLYMLGPTLERFEAAVSTVAGLPVIRDDGEIFLDYDDGSIRTGNDGVFDAETRTFTSATAAFVQEDLSRQLFVTTGYNARRSFVLSAILSPTTVELLDTPTTDTAVSWEMTQTNEHTVRTSRAVYTFPRMAPIKEKFLEPANAGVLTLRAFEVISSAFTVTDYVETPRWWERAAIPQVLLPDYSDQRRQSTPALFENVIDPGDDARIGDPGFFIGADDEGVVPPQAVLASGTGDGALLGDPLYPSSTSETFFSAASAAFTAADLGNYIRVAGIDYRISGIVSATQVRIVSYLPLPYDGLPLVDWELITGTLPLRHTAAYVILDTLLKHHLFTVRFDAFLLAVLQTDVLKDLQDLVFAAKPTYTYLVLTPGLLFDEVIRVTEPEFSANASLVLAGQGGEEVLGNLTPLRIDGTWEVGGWYRYVSNTDTFSAPLATLSDALGAVPANYTLQLCRFYIDPAAFTQSGVPVAYDAHRQKVVTTYTAGGAVSVSGGAVFFTKPGGAAFTNADLMNYVEIQAPATNAGIWRIGRVVSDHVVCLDHPSGSAESPVTFRFRINGAREGRFWVDAEGQSFFDDTDGKFGFEVADVGTYIRRPYPLASRQAVYRIEEIIDAGRVRVATLRDTAPASPDLEVLSYVDNVLVFADPFVHEGLTYTDRRIVNAATAKARQYFVVILSGSYAGETLSLETYLSPDSAAVNAYAGTPDYDFTARLVCRDHYAGVSEGGDWEQYVPQVIIDNDSARAADVTLPTAGVDTDTVSYEAYGIQRPAVPFAVPFSPELGDTYYCIDGVDPLSRYTRGRTARDVSIAESPLQIIATPSVDPMWYITEDGFDMVTEDGYNMAAEAGPILYDYITEDGFTMITEDGFTMETE